MNILLAFPLSMLLHELMHYVFHYVVLHKAPEISLTLSWNRFRLRQGNPADWRDRPFVDLFFLYLPAPYIGVLFLVLVNQWLWVPLHLLYSHSDIKSLIVAWRSRHKKN